MLVIHGPNGSINWGYTSTFLRNNYADYIHLRRTRSIPKTAQDVWLNFGAGAEPAFTCANCNRTLPLALGEVDHIEPKSTLTVKRVTVGEEITRNGKQYSFPPSGKVFSIDITSPSITIRRFRVKADGCLYLSTSTDAEITARSQLPGRNVFTFKPGGTPLSAVARNDVLNLQLLCGWCNRSKGNR